MIRMDYENALRLDLKVPPCYGCVRTQKGDYATVTFGIKYTSSDYEKAAPLYYWDYDEEEIDSLDEFPSDFIAEVNDRGKDHFEIAILYIANPMGGSGKCFKIDLSNKEQEDILGKLDVECMKHYGKPYKTMLAEARVRMEE